jgi:hypothetical protein
MSRKSNGQSAAKLLKGPYPMEKVHRLEEAGLAPSRMWKQSFIIRPTVCWAQGIVRPARKGLGGSDIEPALNGYGALSASIVMCQSE